MWTELAAIFGGTFVSEDLTSITTGLLIRSGSVGLPAGLVACFLGIYFGDLGLWLGVEQTFAVASRRNGQCRGNAGWRRRVADRQRGQR